MVFLYAYSISGIVADTALKGGMLQIMYADRGQNTQLHICVRMFLEILAIIYIKW